MIDCTLQFNSKSDPFIPAAGFSAAALNATTTPASPASVASHTSFHSAHNGLNEEDEEDLSLGAAGITASHGASRGATAAMPDRLEEIFYKDEDLTDPDPPPRKDKPSADILQQHLSSST